MKNKVHIFLSLFMFAVLIGCSEDSFLEETPKDNLYADNLYTTGEGFQLGINALLQFVRSEREEPVASAEFGFGWEIGDENGGCPRNVSLLRGASVYHDDWPPGKQWISGSNGVWGHLDRAINTSNVLMERSQNPDTDWGGTSEEANAA